MNLPDARNLGVIFLTARPAARSAHPPPGFVRTLDRRELCSVRNEFAPVAHCTTGEERVAVPGGNRSLPKTTTITVEANGCGESEEWDASTQHSETRTLCVQGDEVRLAGFESKVSFFGFGSDDTYACGTDAVVY